MALVSHLICFQLSEGIPPRDRQHALSCHPRRESKSTARKSEQPITRVLLLLHWTGSLLFADSLHRVSSFPFRSHMLWVVSNGPRMCSLLHGTGTPTAAPNHRILWSPFPTIAPRIERSLSVFESSRRSHLPTILRCFELSADALNRRLRRWDAVCELCICHRDFVAAFADSFDPFRR